MNRKEILSKITNGSEWALPEETKNYGVIKENLKYLKAQLKLSNLERELSVMYVESDTEKISGSITNRQMNCLDNITENVAQKNVQGAFHELFDFIESYKQLEDKPIDIVERIVIQNAIKQIESILS